MEQRILAEGITTMRQLCALTRERMHTIWGGVLGDRLWLWLRGEDFLEPPARPLQTLSRQHILPPDCRTPDKARAVALKLLHSTARKMRRNDLWAGGLSLQVGFYDHVAFACNARIEPCHDPYTLQEHLIAVWPQGSWPELETQDHIKADLVRLPRLLPETKILFKRTLNGKMNDQEYRTAIADFLGEGYHATGARLLSVIEEVHGRFGVLSVMDDPRKLLTVYNVCAAKATEPFRFDPQLAKALERLGMSGL